MRRRALAWAFAALGLLATPAFAADTVYYYYTDSLHSAVAVTDAQGNVIERTYYGPYGQVLNRDLRDGPGYAGHEEDPETGLVYMQQRYYCPECGRFISTDPVGVDPTTGGNFNRYEYANDNPYRYTDPDGRDCKTAGKQINCSVMITGSHIPVKWSVPAPAGFPAKINSSQSNYHHYDIGVSAGAGSASRANALRQTLVRDPTPGVDKPATAAGTENNASPQSGFLGLAGKVKASPVESYTRTYQGHTIVVNVTLPGHPLFPGYAARIVTTSHGVSTIQNVGEGLAPLQGRFSPFANTIDNVWIPLSQNDINNTH